MRNLLRVLSLVVAFSFLSACAPAAGTALSPTSTQSASATPTALPSATLTPVPATQTPTAMPTLPTAVDSKRTQYSMDAAFDYPKKHLTIEERVSYTNRTPAALTDLVMVVEANRSANVFHMQALTLAGSSDLRRYTLAKEKLSFSLPQPLQPGQTLDLTLTYSLNLPTKNDLLGVGRRQVNLAGWYPYFPPYINGQGWLVNPPGLVGEYQVYELADFDVSLNLNEAPAGLIVAASAANDAVPGAGYHYSQKNARNFTLSLSTDTVQLDALAGSTLVSAYVFKGDEAPGQASLEATVKALTLFSKLFGPYDQATLAVVEVDFADGMEEDGLYFLGKEYFTAYAGSPDGYLTALSAHETAHQWWFAMAGNDQAREPWLDEALATYSERLFYENEYPNFVSWWEQTRVQSYAPQGWVNSSIYDFSAFRPYVNAVYLRGASFLADQRQAMGDAAFLAFLQTYFRQIQAQGLIDNLALSSADAFWTALSTSTSADPSALKNSYFKK